jgi:hypothetical protein
VSKQVRKHWRWMKWLLIMLPLTIGMGPCQFASTCKTFTGDDGPVEPKYIKVEARYQRMNDDSNCPILWSERDRIVLLAELATKNQEMEKVEENIYVVTVESVGVNYPEKKYGGLTYDIYVLDNAFYDYYNDTGCENRAHLIWLNGYLMQKIHKKGQNREYLLVRFDENGVPHEE